MESLSSYPTEGKRRLQFAYDAQGRRIRKTVWKNNVLNTLIWNQISDEFFVYDGWNLIANLDTNLAAQATFVWGLDLSGSIPGAGGVGGLLVMSEVTSGSITNPCFAAYDGNGNVAALLHIPSSSFQAKYEYGPFAEPLRATGAMAKKNPFRFSTKYQDDETDLLYYGYRFYSPSPGRWLSRDPIFEVGSMPWLIREGLVASFGDFLGANGESQATASLHASHNLNVFVDNCSLQYIDLLGAYVCACAPGTPPVFAQPKPIGPGTLYPVGTQLKTAPYTGSCVSTALTIKGKCYCFTITGCWFQDTWTVFDTLLPGSPPTKQGPRYIWLPISRNIAGTCFP